MAQDDPNTGIEAPESEKASDLPLYLGKQRSPTGTFQSKFDPDKALEIIERLAEGQTLTAICKGQPGMPHPNTFRRWMVHNPEFAKAYSVAIQVSAASLEEEALDSARAIAAKHKDGTHVRAVEVKLGQLRWSMERRDPSKYGQRTQVNVKVPVQIITPLNLNFKSDESIPDIYNLKATVPQAGTIATATGGEPLPKPKPFPYKGKKKQALIPPGGRPIPQTPFGKLVRGITHENADVRSESGGQCDREQSGGSRDPQPDSPRSQEEHSRQEGGGGTVENPEGSWESE